MNEVITQAFSDCQSFLSDKTTKEKFVSAYKVGAVKSIQYAAVVDMLTREAILSPGFNKKDLLEESGLSSKEILELGKSQNREKLVGALFDVAYTRTPSQEKGGDGKPMSWDREANTGYAAEIAFKTLKRIDENSPVFHSLKTNFAYPRKAEDYKATNSAIRESILDGSKKCASQNRFTEACFKDSKKR